MSIYISKVGHNIHVWRTLSLRVSYLPTSIRKGVYVTNKGSVKFKYLIR